jgi:hypothetical protein
MEKLDILLKNALKESVDPSEQDIEKNFLKFKMNLVNCNDKKIYFERFSYINFKKVVAISICCLLCAATILIGYSGTVRATTLGALDSIKSIFVVEGTGKDLKIVNKPTSEDFFTISEGHNTLKSDAELGKILGYKIKYPIKTAGGFELQCRTLHVVLEKKISYDVMPAIRKQLTKAIENQEEFSKLADYSPFRTVSGRYKKGDTNIYIYASPEQTSTPFDCYEKEEIEIGGIKGFWCKDIYPEYPYKEGSSDMSVKPVIKDTFSLYWENNGVQYLLSSLIGNDLSKAEAIKIAKEFQAAQP